MKKILITLVSIAVIIVLLHLILFVFINLKGRDIIVAKFQEKFGQEVELDSLTLSFPFAIEITNFKSGDISVRRARASLGLSNPFRNLVISNLSLEDLALNITMDRKGIRSQPVFSKPWRRRRQVKPEQPDQGFSLPGQSSEFQPRETESKKIEGEGPLAKKFPLAIKNIYITGGKIQFKDELRKQPIVITIININAHLKNFSYPKLKKFYLDINGSLKTEEAVSKKNIDLKGWLDYSKKDMDVTLALAEIKYRAFADYYPPNWKPDKLGIKEALLSLDSSLISENNELAINNVLALDSIEYLELKEGEEESSRRKTLKTILALLKGNNDKPSFNFIIKTKMDSPRIDSASIKKSFKETLPFAPAMILQSVVGEFKEGVEEKLKDTKELTVDETVEILKETGEEIVDTLKSIFIPKEGQEEDQSGEVQNQEYPNPELNP